MTLTQPNYKHTKYTCFYTYLAMSSVFSLPPLLFLTFREQYGVSYTLLGTLVLVNFCTQLLVDLLFTFFTKYFNIKKMVRLMPLLTSVGLMTYALFPALVPQHAYLGLLVGTVVFSVAAGLNEVLMSPLVAALPSDNPERDMSALHSLYAYGVLTVVVLSTVFFQLFGTENWMYLTIFWALLPLGSFVLFSFCPIPEINIDQSEANSHSKFRRRGLMLCLACIFLGSASENSMTIWISGFIEKSLQIPKALGDLLGMALFAVLLGLTRTWYAKFGKNIYRVLLVGMAGAVFCYIVAALSPIPLLAMAACILTGVCTSMLWPGTLILMEEKFPGPGITAYALMAAGGDFGASVAPQMLGVVVDKVAESPWAIALSSQLSIDPDQLGMKVGMLTATIFPVLGVALLLYMGRYFRRHSMKTI